MSAPLKYKTLKAPSTADFRDRGSKFLAFAYPVKGEADIKAHLSSLRKQHPKANHHCYAWRMGTDGNAYRAVDDGEPAGSAGRPILGQIDSKEVTNVLVVVVRYFGGTLLGVPGLINAYKTATEDALSSAETIEHWVETNIHLEFDYPVMGEVLYILKQHEATITKQDLQLFCTIEAGIPSHLYDTCKKSLSEIRSVKLV